MSACLSTLELDMLGLSIAALLSTIDQKRVHLVDSYPRDQPHNFIFRGNNPTTKGSNHTTMDYNGLVAAVKTAANTECDRSKSNSSFENELRLVGFCSRVFGCFLHPVHASSGPGASACRGKSRYVHTVRLRGGGWGELSCPAFCFLLD